MFAHEISHHISRKSAFWVVHPLVFQLEIDNGSRYIIPHDDVIKWKHFPRYWPFVLGIHRWPVSSPHKGQWRGAMMFSLICASINGWVNNRKAIDLRRHRAYYDVTVMHHIRGKIIQMTRLLAVSLRMTHIIMMILMMMIIILIMIILMTTATTTMMMMMIIIVSMIIIIMLIIVIIIIIMMMMISYLIFWVK